MNSMTQSRPANYFSLPNNHDLEIELEMIATGCGVDIPEMTVIPEQGATVTVTDVNLWDEEGNDIDGYKAAVRYTMKAAMMKGPWVKWDGMASRWKFLYFTVRSTESFETSWGFKTKF